MRRFVATTPGRALCHFVVAALLLPFLTLMSVGRADAQLQTLPTWAVIDFVNRSGKGGADIGRLAAEAVGNELSKTNRYDVLPREQVGRAIETLQLATPVTEQTSLFRLAQELRATELVTGDVLNYRIRPSENGKQADVIVRAVVRNVASGIPINGAAASASSSIRPGDTPDDVILSEAFSFAATKIVNEIVSRTLPRATILNTFESSAIINQGSRSGIKEGQEVIVLRGTEQVATASVVEVSYDDATIRLRQSDKGLRPGDKVQVVFAPPAISSTFDREGKATVVRERKGRNNNAFIQLLGAAAILAFLFSGGKSNRNDVVDRVTSEATFGLASTGPGVRIAWSTDMFVQGNEQKVEWHIWRNDFLDSPVLVAPGSQSSIIDNTAARDINSSTAPVSSFGCPPLSGGPSATGVPGVVPGQPYVYQVELVYRVRSEDVPGQPAGGFCHFMSTRQTAQGIATPLNRPLITSPAQGETISEPRLFTVDLIDTGWASSELVLQLSSRPDFTSNTTETIGPIVTLNKTEIGFGLIDTFNGRISAVRNASVVYWRVGVRNADDNPGPVPDANTRQRYIFSLPQSFNRPVVPPPPPSS